MVEAEREPEELEGNGAWSDADSEADMAELMKFDLRDETPGTGKSEYLARCEQLKIVPVAMFIAKLECPQINLRHHGIGAKGSSAVAAALQHNAHIRTLNLGDNWLGDEGAAAVGAVLGQNKTLTSLDLAENRIGIYGARALCDGILKTTTLKELVLRGNGFDDRSAVPLFDAIGRSSTLTRVDLSSNALGEEAGRLAGAALVNNSHLFDLHLGWNSLRAKGGAAVAEALKSNSGLCKLNLSFNGIADAGARVLAEALPVNSALTNLDVSHNRIGCAGALALAEGLRANRSLVSCELSNNPMTVGEGLKVSLEGVQAIVSALRENTTIESIGLSHIQEGAERLRGDAPRLDPKKPDGHYRLDLAQPWDSFVCETLYDRMQAEAGESWLHAKLQGAPLVLPRDGSRWEIPIQGVLEFGYVTWRRGMEVTLELDLSNSGDAFLAAQVLARVRSAGGDDSPTRSAGEAFRDCRLDGVLYTGADGGYGGDLPATGKLKLTYVCHKPLDEISCKIHFDLAAASDRDTALRLWERALTAPSEMWKAATLNGDPVQLGTWQYPELPPSGILELEHSIGLAARPTDRGRHFSPTMNDARFRALLETLSSEALADDAKVALIKQAASRNYFGCAQVLPILGALAFRKAKIEAAVMLHARVVDAKRFTSVLQALSSEEDRQAVLAAVGGGRRS